MGQFGVNAQNQKGLGGQDTTQILQKMFTGRIVGSPAIAYGGVAGVVLTWKDQFGNNLTTISTCKVTVPLAHGQSLTYTCTYEPRYLPPSGTALIVPAGTPCFIAFPANGSHDPWVIAFSGWPS